MSYYTDRWVLFKSEGTWGTWITPDTMPNYLMEWSATTTENKEEEDLIGGSRDQRKMLWLEEGVVGRWSQEVVSAKIFEFILGSLDPASDLISTYTPGSTLPSMSIYRGMYPNEAGGTASLGYMGMKVDTADLTVENAGDVRIEVNLAGKGATIPSAVTAGSINMSEQAFAFHHSSLDLIYSGPSTINLDNLEGYVISINNNLEPRYSAGALTYKAVGLREGVMEVTGRLTLSGDIPTLESIAVNRQDCTIKAYLMKPGSTIDITVKNVTFGEIPDELSGLDPVVLEYPFTARPDAGSDAIVVVETSLYSLDVLKY